MNIDKLFEYFFSVYSNPTDKPRVFFAPGRVNLIGEHTDYNGGFVLPCALQYGTYLLIRPSSTDSIKFASNNFDFRCEIKLNELSEKVDNKWVNYPLGIIDQLRQLNIEMTGFEMLFSGDIPNSAGLSSSASIEMVTAYGLTTILNATDLSMVDLVKLAQRAENQFVGVNCGIMDQFAVGMGSKDHALFLNCQTLEYKNIPVLLNGFALIIANTNKSRGLAGSKYNERVAECQLAVTYLNPLIPLSKLGEISYMQFYKIQDQIPDELIRRRARHVISENQRVLNAVSCLYKGDLVQFGALMNASHESLRDNYEVTGVELDTLVEEAQKIHGVIGARMTGAGFGGCTVNLVRKDIIPVFMEKVESGYFAKTGIRPIFYHTEISDGVKEINCKSKI
ncbi:MAG: galactokinase [Bacteroidales bacterium]|jgi:galactokinase|nr:galactokinase [Bacteroidales bacterium]